MDGGWFSIVAPPFSPICFLALKCLVFVWVDEGHVEEHTTGLAAFALWWQIIVSCNNFKRVLGFGGSLVTTGSHQLVAPRRPQLSPATSGFSWRIVLLP